MVAETKPKIIASLLHKNVEGKDCNCQSGINHHLDSRSRDCACLIGRNHHKDSKNEECICKIGQDHNTKPSSHKDRDGRLCSGPFAADPNIRGKRMCRWCRREENYSLTELTIVFKKDITDVKAMQFLMETKVNGQTLTIVSDKAKGIIEKNSIVAVTVIVPSTSQRSVEELVDELEKAELIWFVSRVMVVSFHDAWAVDQETRPKPPDRRRHVNDPDFPDEMMA